MIKKKMESAAIDQIVSKIKSQNSYLIAICGIPGSGKTYLSNLLHQKLQSSIVIPFDGYHIYRKDLTQMGIKYRGASFTFDLHKFQQQIKLVKKQQHFPVYFPSFDHAVKDPIEDSIVLTQDIKHVIVEGLYLYDSNLQLQDCWDVKIWIDAQIDVAMDRVTKRHLSCGIQPTLEMARNRTNENDRKNAKYLIQNSNLSKALFISNN